MVLHQPPFDLVAVGQGIGQQSWRPTNYLCRQVIGKDAGTWNAFFVEISGAASRVGFCFLADMGEDLIGPVEK
jgi:hypothetical protein